MLPNFFSRPMFRPLLGGELDNAVNAAVVPCAIAAEAVRMLSLPVP